MFSYHDLETYSETPITNGTWAYSEKAEVMLWVYALEDSPVSVWDLTDGSPMPGNLAALLADSSIKKVWHNGAMFDEVVLMQTMGIHIPMVETEDTLVQALQHSLPGSLAALCDILGVDADQAKDKRGKALIQLFCKPQPANRKHRRCTRETHPKEWQEFIDYAKSDIRAMRQVHKKMPRWNLRESEMALWHLDQIVNRRGMCMDMDLARAALGAVDIEQIRLKKETSSITGGEVDSATKRDQMLDYILMESGILLSDLKKSTIERMLGSDDFDDGIKALLRIRLQATSSSTAKYKTLLKSVSTDGRLRGTKQFCGASRTGRWGGRLFQPDNMPRPTMKAARIAEGIEALKGGYADILVPDIMELTKNAIRGCIIAPKGKKLVVADLSNIEGRSQAWLVGEQWKIDAFNAYDNGTGHDLYVLAYAKSFGVTPEAVIANKKQGGNWRQIGKVMELALAYEGGVGAFITFAAAYGIDLEKLADQAYPNIPKDIWERAERMLEWHEDQKRRPLQATGLSKKAWLVCESFKLAWRDSHPNIAAHWKELGETVKQAISRPGVTFPCRKVKIRVDGKWMRIVLPSGRALCYPFPRVIDDKIVYKGVNQYTRKWDDIHTYGGKVFENVTQAFARDVFGHGMLLAEADGFENILSVHDEALTETPDTPDYTVDRLSAHLSAPIVWAPGLPLAAAGFEDYRYRKDD